MTLDPGGHVLSLSWPMVPQLQQHGTSFVEIVLSVGLVATLIGLSVSVISHGVEATRAASAARYLLFELRLARVRAVTRSRVVALRFERDGRDFWTITPYADGDGDGVRITDIRAGIDRRVGPSERLAQKFPGVRFGILAGVHGIGGTPLDPGDPLVIGSTDLVSFSPEGSATSGTLYVRDRVSHQYAVRILGVTGRVRLLEYSFASGTWVAR